MASLGQRCHLAVIAPVLPPFSAQARRDSISRRSDTSSPQASIKKAALSAGLLFSAAWRSSFTCSQRSSVIPLPDRVHHLRRYVEKVSPVLPADPFLVIYIG